MLEKNLFVLLFFNPDLNSYYLFLIKRLRAMSVEMPKKKYCEKSVLDGTRTHNLWLTHIIKAPEANALSIRPQGRHGITGAKIG